MKSIKFPLLSTVLDGGLISYVVVNTPDKCWIVDGQMKRAYGVRELDSPNGPVYVWSQDSAEKHLTLVSASPLRTMC